MRFYPRSSPPRIPWWRHQMETFYALLAFVRGIHRSPVNSPHKGQWRGALMFTLICARINGWVSNPEAGDLRRHHAHYDAIVMIKSNTLVRIMINTHGTISRWYDTKSQTHNWNELGWKLFRVGRCLSYFWRFRKIRNTFHRGTPFVRYICEQITCLF